MLILQNITYTHPAKDLLFDNITFTVHHQDKIALVGNNGVGKSTLLRIICGHLQPTAGTLTVSSTPYYVPQLFGQYNDMRVSEALGVTPKLYALQEILKGDVTEQNLEILNDDWTIEERCYVALRDWQLPDIGLSEKMETLSGGQKTRVFLAGIDVHQPKLVLLDEPSNHLDGPGRERLYQFVQSTSSTLVAVSHDRKLLNMLDSVVELDRYGMHVYGGNYDFYAGQKHIERHALNHDIQSKETALRKARQKERATMERQQRLNARGKKKQEKAGVAKIMMNTLRNAAENSTSKAKEVHAEKISGISSELQELRSAVPDVNKMKLRLDESDLHKGKILVAINDINVRYANEWMWKEKLTLEIRSGERIALQGPNGSGKTTLIKVILGELTPQTGHVHRSAMRSVYIDQDYSLIDNNLTVYDQVQRFNTSLLQEHEIGIRLTRFLFGREKWDKRCSALSGGERMRLMLCCLTISSDSPDLIVLDEPTNNLDIQNLEILTAAIHAYEGTLIVVSHDEYFLEQVDIVRRIML